MALINLNNAQIRVYDYTGKEVLSTYALKQTPLKFVPDLSLVQLISSTFTPPGSTITKTNTFYVADNNDYSNIKIRWDFGDNTYQIAPTGEKYYEFPGEYKVTLYLINENGQSFKSTIQPTINVVNFITDRAYFEPPENFIIDIPAGRLSDKLTLTRYNSWQSYNILSGSGYTFNLYSSGTGSFYYSVENYYNDKWGHLKKFYKFVQKKNFGNVLQDVIVDKVTTSNVELFAKISNNSVVFCNRNEPGAFFVGTSGNSEFYYTDDSNKNNTSNSPPIILFASFDTSKIYDFWGLKFGVYEDMAPLELGYINFPPAAVPIIKTRYNPASILTITNNGLDGEGENIITTFNLNKTNYADSKIPFVIKLKDQENYTTKSYPYLSATNLSPTSSYYFNVQLVDTNNTIVPSVSFYKTNFEEEIYDSGGFYRGYFISPNHIENAKLSAVVYIDDVPNFEQDTAFIFYSQPYTEYIGRHFSSSKLYGCKGKPNTTTITYDFINTRNNRNIFSITQSPSSNTALDDYCFYAADCDSDRILKFDYKGNILRTFNLSSMLFDNGYTASIMDLRKDGSASPSSIALDKQNNAYITLFDSGSVIRINNFTNRVDRIFAPYLNYFTTSGNYVSLSGFAGENIILPTYVDVDKNNDIFVSYSHPVSSFILKMDSDGTIKNSYIFTKFLSPQKILVDRNNDLWVAIHNNNFNPPNLNDRNDYIYKFDNTLQLYSGGILSGFKLPCDITVDGKQNCWVAHNDSKVTKIFNDLSSTKTFLGGDIYNITKYLNAIEGLGCNSNNEIVVLNNFERKFYFYNAETSEQPLLSTIPIIEIESATNNFVRYPLSAYYEDKYQADGDFLGFNWINKFYYFAKNKKYITGTSTTFNVYPASGYNLVFKKNEDFDGEQYYKNLLLMETLQDNPNLWDNFIGKIVGDEYSNNNTALLKRIYEKIANFENNISDVDFCNIDALVSKCDMFDVNYEKFSYPYPSSVKRMVDLFSIKKNRLFGTKTILDYSFKIKDNLGDYINVVTDSFSATETIVVQEKFSQKYKLVNINLINSISSTSILPFSAFNKDWGWGLVVPASLSGIDVRNYYDFYRLKSKELAIVDNYIDYENPNTTISFNITGYDEWYGQDGIIDQNLTYAFTNGLRLISSASNVFYN
jgi:hypothetical protein